MVIFLFLFYFVTTIDCFNFQKDGVDIKYKVSNFKTCVDIPEISKLSITSVPLNDCVFNCAVTRNCDGLVFKRQFPLCELYKGPVNELERTGNCVHIKREDIRDVNGNGQQCAANGDTACSNIGCQYPEIQNGKPEGNMFSVGSTQIIKCDTGYVIHGNDTIKCMENGIWNSLPECWKECTELKIPFANVTWNTTHADMTCYTDFVSNKTEDYNQNITTETFTCDKQGNWSPNVECTHYNNILNIALHKNATQRSTSNNRTATRATDGIWDSNMTASKSCSHTKPLYLTSPKEIQTWWEVDLEKEYSIQTIFILTRDDLDTKSRLHNFDVLVGNHSPPNTRCFNHTGVTTKGSIVKINCIPTSSGRYVRINKLNSEGHDREDNLALCEVGVYVK
ncbi:uncharacterized protein LOC132743807 isoform X2 [Ruditapes philippinarum]|uniref:uncharacterized protein LOC132743807 isoform X2 n=1 Tax=Ruditapes philippinarum TaxID=129788 RepID=UPI00295A5872|nr:uncharacterized protein LOC132743807 isoform X2 [Ruditapes philippinarum]